MAFAIIKKPPNKNVAAKIAGNQKASLSSYLENWISLIRLCRPCWTLSSVCSERPEPGGANDEGRIV